MANSQLKKPKRDGINPCLHCLVDLGDDGFWEMLSTRDLVARVQYLQEFLQTLVLYYWKSNAIMCNSVNDSLVVSVICTVWCLMLKAFDYRYLPCRWFCRLGFLGSFSNCQLVMLLMKILCFFMFVVLKDFRGVSTPWSPLTANFISHFWILIIIDTEMGTYRTLKMILLSHRTQIDSLISSWFVYRLASYLL